MIHRSKGARSSPAFTLIELLVVMAVIAVLASLLLATLSAAKNKARGAQCVGNLKQLGLAHLMYLGDFGKSVAFGGVDGFARFAKVAICPNAREHAGVAPRKAASAPAENKIFAESGTADEAWLFPTNAMPGIAGMASMPIRQSSYGFNGWLYSSSSGFEGPDDSFRFGSESQFQNTSATPVFADAIWRDAWPRSTDRPGFNAYFGWNDGGIGRFFVARHGAARRDRENHPLERPLKGLIYMTLADGHVEGIKLEKLYDLEWHRDYHSPFEGK